jgi:hypothetical protein
MKITHTCKLKLNCITIIFPFSWTEFWSLASNCERKGATQNNTYSKRVGKSIRTQILSFIRKCFMGCYAYIAGFTVHLLRAGRQTLSLDKALRVSQYTSHYGCHSTQVITGVTLHNSLRVSQYTSHYGCHITRVITGVTVHESLRVSQYTSHYGCHSTRVKIYLFLLSSQ